MEELLALYGATCVAAVRPSLERLLSDHESEGTEAFETSNSHSDEPETAASEVELELTEAPDQPDFHESETPEETSNSHSDEPETVASEVELELTEAPDELSSHNEEPLPPPDLEAVSVSDEVRPTSRPFEKLSAWPEQQEPSPDAHVEESIVLPASSHFIKTSTFESHEKNADSKKKKKKKKKKH
jgi:hypothetical protein